MMYRCEICQSDGPAPCQHQGGPPVRSSDDEPKCTRCKAPLDENGECPDCGEEAHSLQRSRSPAPLSGEWRCSGHMICCGTLRIAVFDIDTQPSDEFVAKLGAWMCHTLNEAQGRKLEAERRLAPVSGLDAVVEVHQTMDAKELLKILDDPKCAANAAKLGWDTNQARIECEKSIASQQAPNDQALRRR